MTSTKRAYKLQEFVAHSSNVNCLKIGRRTSRVIATGGEDHKVNLWAVGKPNAILNLSGHTSAVESVNFDSGEVLVAAGAANGTIKLWDLEEAKILRTLTGHRSNCTSVDFHPFGEFFASGSLDTNLKIWDIRRKGCIQTYKGHTRGVNAIRFTPDGRWLVSGGEDSTVKLWDLTAGKLLHDFKSHEGQVQCIDFHPHEFLLATGSADKTVKFWDLETFELTGSAGPETTGVRAMSFNPDGRTLLCGLHESLKVFSWEPVRCHDAVDVGWSRLSDLNIHEGKLLGCSYNQSCVGVWVVDVSRIEPHAIASIGRLNSRAESKSTTNSNLVLQIENNIKVSMGRLSVSQNAEPVVKEAKPAASNGSSPSTPQRLGINSVPKVKAVNSASLPSSTPLKRSSSKSHVSTNPQMFSKSDVVPVVISRTTNSQAFNKSDVVPVTVPRKSSRMELTSEFRRENSAASTVPFNAQPKLTEFRKHSIIRNDSDKESGLMSNKTKSNEDSDQDSFSADSGVNRPASAGDRNVEDVRFVRSVKLGVSQLPEPSTSYYNENCEIRVHKPRHVSSVGIPKGGRTRSLVANWEKEEPYPSCEYLTSNNSSDTRPTSTDSYMRGRPSSAEKERVSESDEDAIADLMENHQQFMNSAQSHLTKLQVVRRLWGRKDVRGLISAMEKMSDHSVSADVVSVLMEKIDLVTLDICTNLLPLLTSLLESKMDRHLSISVEMLLKLVKIFGNVVHSTVTAGPLVGVDLQAEQRLERCNLCFIELEKLKHILPSLTRRGGSLAKSTQELNLALQEVL